MINQIFKRSFVFKKTEMIDIFLIILLSLINVIVRGFVLLFFLLLLCVYYSKILTLLSYY